MANPGPKGKNATEALRRGEFFEFLKISAGVIFNCDDAGKMNWWKLQPLPQERSPDHDLQGLQHTALFDMKFGNCSTRVSLVATLSVLREARAFGIAAQLKNHASRKLRMVARAQSGYQNGGA